MTLKLVPPRGTRKCWAIRGTVDGVRIERTTGCTNKRDAELFLKKAQKDEREDRLRLPTDPTFKSASVKYLRDSRSNRFLDQLNEEIGDTALKLINQDFVDDLAFRLYPDASPATRNRQVYTPLIAVLRSAGFATLIRRPKGAQGRMRTEWLEEDEAGRLIEAAYAKRHELGILVTLLLSTGMRLSEALKLRCSDLRTQQRFLFLKTTKNGEPRRVYLTNAALVALQEHPKGIDRGNDKLFPWSKSGALYDLIHDVYAKANVDPRGEPFHLLRHTFATWMRRYTGADDITLLKTGAWADPASVRRYAHAGKNEADSLQEMLPIPYFSGHTQKTPNARVFPGPRRKFPMPLKQ